MKNNIFIVDIEPIETRYTAQWQKHLPKLLTEQVGEKYNVTLISGKTAAANTPAPGAFLDFAATNIYKSEQGLELFNLIQNNIIKTGDVILFTDAWNPIIIQLKYILDLCKIDAKIIGLWHAGSYDKWDFLGRLIKDKRWSYSFEKSLFHAIDINCFATDYHIKLFSGVLDIDLYIYSYKFLRTGWPMEYLPEALKSYSNIQKEDIILFPHRIAPEKQLDIFKDLEKSLPQYKWIVAQEQVLTKDEYHTLLGKSKIVFSANLQETLGISMYEGALVNSIPFLPDRLSYSEMYDFKYDSKLTDGFDKYLTSKDILIEKIKNTMENYSILANKLPELSQKLSNNFFSFTNLINIL